MSVKKPSSRALFSCIVSALFLATVLSAGSSANDGGSIVNQESVAANEKTALQPDPSRIEREEAIAQAVRRLGLPDVSRKDVIAHRIILDGDSVPFLHKEVAGKASWLLEFSNVKLPSKDRNGESSNAHIKRLFVTLAPSSGEILKVESALPSEEIPALEFPRSSQEEEARLSRLTTRYSRLPAEEPKVTLLDAIGVSLFWSDSIKHMRANYVVEAGADGVERPVWVIYLQGDSISYPVSQMVIKSHPSPASRDSSAISPRSVRNVVDAKSGKWLYGGTLPQLVKATETVK